MIEKFKPTEIHVRGVTAFALWAACLMALLAQAFGFIDWVLRHVRIMP